MMGALTDAPLKVLAELVTASHILADQGVVDGFGHVSIRHPGRADRYLLPRSKAPELVEESDILELSLSSEVVSPGEHRPFLERFIHGELYRARPDVMAVVHSHSPSVIPFSVVPSVPLRSVSHMGAFLGTRTPVFEIREVRGEATDMLVRDPDLAQALASTLGDRSVVLMRGHGSTVVGASLRQAVFRAVYAEFNARMQLQAMQLGPVIYLTAEEGEAAAATNDGQIDRAWDLWQKKAESNRVGP